MLVNPSKTRGMLISRSRTVEPLFPDLVIDGSVVEMVSELKILGVILDSKLTFEKQVRAIAASASMRVGILRKTMSVFRDVAVVAQCFWAFILPVLEYCSPVWMSAATSHLSLLDRVVSQISRLSGRCVSCDLWNRRKVASLSVFFVYPYFVFYIFRSVQFQCRTIKLVFKFVPTCYLSFPFFGSKMIQYEK